MGSSENPAPHHETPAFGNPDLPPEGMQTTIGDPAGTKMTGPRNPVLESQFPNVITAPATDISTQPFFWSSFNISPRRQQRGGWAREVTQADFAISDEIAGVNMYLEPGGIRELHWHQTAEWAIMTQGKCRVTTLSREGLPSVEDVFSGDLWFFPAGLPHSLQGLGPDGAEFVLAFDNGKQSESNTLLLTDWFAHTPPDVLAKNFRVAQETFDDIPLHNLWIFPGDEPGDLEADQVAAGVQWGGTEPVIFRMSQSEAGLREQRRQHPHRGQHELPGVQDDGGRPGHGQAGQHARAALAPERRRVAVLHARVRADDGVQHRPARQHHRLPGR